MPTPPTPAWYEPLATGMRLPIFNVAFWPSDERSCGFSRMRVLLSLNRKFAVAAGMVTRKFVAFRLANWLRLICPVVPVVGVVAGVVVPLVVAEVLVLQFAPLTLHCRATETLAGG